MFLFSREHEFVPRPKINIGALLSACMDVIDRGGREVVRIRGLSDIGKLDRLHTWFWTYQQHLLWMLYCIILSLVWAPVVVKLYFVFVLPQQVCTMQSQIVKRMCLNYSTLFPTIWVFVLYIYGIVCVTFYVVCIGERTRTMSTNRVGLDTQRILLGLEPKPSMYWS